MKDECKLNLIDIILYRSDIYNSKNEDMCTVYDKQELLEGIKLDVNYVSIMLCILMIILSALFTCFVTKAYIERKYRIIFKYSPILMLI